MRYHALRRSRDGARANVAFHLDTPAGNNTADISYANLILRTRGASSLVRHLSLDFASEWAELVAGSKFEYYVNGFEFVGTNLTDAQRRAQLRAKYIQLATDIANKNSDLFAEVFGVIEWFGYAEDYDGSWSDLYDYPNNGAIPEG